MIKTIFYTVMYGVYCIFSTLVLVFMLSGCGTTIKVKGGTTNTAVASGEVKQINEVVLRIDVSACDKVEPSDQGKCIKDIVSTMGDLVEMIKSFYCKTPECMADVSKAAGI